jgi:hypothetical protein
VDVSAPEDPELMFVLCLEEKNENGKAMALTTIELARP